MKPIIDNIVSFRLHEDIAASINEAFRIITGSVVSYGSGHTLIIG